VSKTKPPLVTRSGFPGNVPGKARKAQSGGLDRETGTADEEANLEGAG